MKIMWAVRFVLRSPSTAHHSNVVHNGLLSCQSRKPADTQAPEDRRCPSLLRCTACRVEFAPTEFCRNIEWLRCLFKPSKMLPHIKHLHLVGGLRWNLSSTSQVWPAKPACPLRPAHTAVPLPEGSKGPSPTPHQQLYSQSSLVNPTLGKSSD